MEFAVVMPIYIDSVLLDIDRIYNRHVAVKPWIVDMTVEYHSQLSATV